MPKIFSKIQILLLCCMLVCSIMPAFNINTTVYAAEVVKTEAAKDKGYVEYIEKFTNVDLANSKVDINIKDYTSISNNIELQDNIVLWKDGKDRFSCEFEITEEGLYNLEIVWKAFESGVNPKIKVYLDGGFPFEECENIVLERLWENVSEKPQTDKTGNEYAQEQKVVDDFFVQRAKDDTGIVIEPYCFFLSKGKHTLTFADCGQPIAISSISFVAPEKTLDYSSISSSYITETFEAEIIYIQGEDADTKSQNTLIPKTDNSNSGMTPSSPYTTKLNYIGGTSWSIPGERVEWNFEVETSGYYSLGYRFKQSQLVNGESIRWLKIDGKTPFTEAKSLKFKYDTGWKNDVFSNGDAAPYYIYLEKGPHTISLEVTLGGLAEYCSRLSDIIDNLADIYVNIVMITGESPDISRDYELFKQIPNLNDNLSVCQKELDNLASNMKKSMAEKGNQYTAAMENMSRIIKNMIDKPYIAQQFVGDYYTNYTSLSSWLYEMKEMPLCIDELQLIPYGKNPDFGEPNIFKSLSFGIKRLLASFVKPYHSKTDGDAEQIRIWINWGQDQAGVLSSLIEDSFTPKTGIQVKLELVNASLVNGILSGNFPDLVMRMSRTEPVNLAMRGALYDLSKFEDYNEVLTRFKKDAEMPYKYKNGTYAIPDTQTFFVMYTRDDVLAQLGLKTPKTWDEFLHATTIIQRNNMNVYIPYTAPAATNGVGMLHLFPTLLAQNNLSIYNQQKTATAFNTESALKVFTDWIDLYTDYSIQKEADFYNRFRTGMIPLGVASYDIYKTIYAAAPEIAGRWSISTLPATNGNYSAAGSGTGCGIIAKSQHKNAAWEFLKWWTSTSTQVRFSNNIESILGTIGRVDTANVEAFSNLDWDSNDLEVLQEQWNNVVEIPEIPGSYYVMRAIDQAYWEVMNGISHDGDAVEKWSIVANNEIKRKIAEYE